MYTDSLPFITGMFFCLMTLGAVIAILYTSFRKRKLRSEEIIAAIEKGVDVPFPPPQQRNYRSLGLIWTGLGIALVIALWVSGGTTAAVWGLLPVGLGVAFLLIAKGQKAPADETAS